MSDVCLIVIAYGLIGAMVLWSIFSGIHDQEDKPTEWEKDEAWRRGHEHKD